MAGTGGARPGAGRKPKAEKFKLPIAKAEKRIADRLPVLIDKMFELADGVTVQTIDDDGVNIYTRPPDRGALTYLIDRIMGKPTEHKEIEHSGGITLDKAREMTDEELDEELKRRGLTG